MTITNTESTKQGSAPKIEPLFNDAFIRIFGRDESRNLTRNFINAIFRSIDLEEIGEIESIQAEHTAIGGSIDCKTARYDILIETDEHILDLEAQRRPDHIANRSLFYGAKILSSTSMKGMRYSELPQVTIIMLLDSQPLFEDESIIHLCQMVWDKDASPKDATDRLRFVLVELAKVRQRYNSLSETVLSDESLAWFYLLTKGFSKEADMQALAERFHTFEEFAELYGLAINDPATMKAYDNAAETWREEEAWKEYFARIRQEGAEESIISLVKDGIIAPEVAAHRLGKAETDILASF